MTLLPLLGEGAAGPGGVTQACFVKGALRELSVGLYLHNFLPYCASVGMLARSSDTIFQAGLSVPKGKCVE
jgi:hypothetical protein